MSSSNNDNNRSDNVTYRGNTTTTTSHEPLVNPYYNQCHLQIMIIIGAIMKLIEATLLQLHHTNHWSSTNKEHNKSIYNANEFNTKSYRIVLLVVRVLETSKVDNKN
jgi:hypothetical protein